MHNDIVIVSFNVLFYKRFKDVGRFAEKHCGWHTFAQKVVLH